MIHSFFILSNTGEVIIEKHWRGLTSRSVCDFFWEQVSQCDSKEVIKFIYLSLNTIVYLNLLSLRV